MSFLTNHAHDGHMGWGGGGMWLWGTLMMLFWVVLIAAVIWLLVRTLGGLPGTPTSTRRARELLAERFARGEMTVEEYRERLDILR
ncbi:MAG TPA: hypothetical protein VFZ32_02405 [Micromonosporaceae bacterium]